MSKKRVALLFAMEAEARPVIQSLKLVRQPSFGDPRLPFEHYSGFFKDSFELLLSLNGKDSRFGVDQIGTEPATLNSYVTFSQFKPDLCINAGTAGGFTHRNAIIGDVYLSIESVRFHDHRIPIPGFDRYGIGDFPVMSLPGMAETLGLKTGVISTGNSLDCTPADSALLERNNASVKEMEAAAIAGMAHLLKIPFMGLKAITDLVDSSHPHKLIQVLGYLAGHASEWP